MSSARKNALGKGLSALLGPSAALQGRDSAEKSEHDVRTLSLTQILPNPRQPRTVFTREALQELCDSIKRHGVLQPILVTPDKKGGYYLLAGERRFRASQLAELKEIPAIVCDATDEEMLEIAIVENVQREDLNAVEEARAYRQLVDAFGWTQENIAQRVGKNRSTVANALRLLQLGDEALADLEAGRLTAGHARAILSLQDSFYRQRLRKEIVEKGISVRDAEKLATAFQKAGPPTNNTGKKTISGKQQGLDTVALEERLMAHLGCRVRIQTRDERSGTVEIPFRSPEELERFLEAIGLTD